VPAARARSTARSARSFDDPTPRAPAPPAVDSDLPERDLADLAFADEVRIERVTLTGQADDRLDARSATIEDARIKGSLANARLHDLHLHDAELAGADLANVDLRGAHLSRLAVADCRATGAQLVETTIVDVTFTGCRLDFAVLSGARLDRVVFRDCDLKECSLEQAQLRDVRFESCDLSRAMLDGSRHQRVELHGCRLEGLRSISDLKGAALPWPDLVDQAPAFAAALGIGVVRDPDAPEERS
jgi:uncharacterized protein YjbI with pentapeptide repeats